MAYTEIGRVRPRPLGTHSASQAYEVMDMVMAADGSKAYIATQAVPAGTALTNAAYWAPVVDVSAAVAKADAAADKAGDAADATNGAIASLVDYQAEMLTRVRGETATQSGALVRMAPDAGSLLRVVSKLEPIQSGTGDPSPSNVRPISGRTGVKLARGGKNLLKIAANNAEIDGVTFTVNADGSVTASGTTTKNIVFLNLNYVNLSTSFLPPGNYVLTGGKSNTRLQLIVNDLLLVTDSGNGASAVIPDGIENSWVRVEIEVAGTTVNETVYPMVRPASVTDGTFEVYKGDTYTADFGQTVYGGTLDWTTGVLAVEWAVTTLTGTESWNYVDAGLETARFGAVVATGIAPGISSNLDMKKSSHFKAMLSVGAGVEDGNGFNLYDSGWVDIVCPAITTVEAWKSYLSAQASAGTPVQIAYKLATPTVIQLTPQLITALAGTNTVYGDVPSDVTWVKPLATSIEEHIAAALAQSAANAAD